VTIDPPDLATQVEQLRVRGEGYTVEFKEELPIDHNKDKMLKTVAGFANGDGGVILFGIENGTGVLKGLHADPAKESDRLTNMVRNVLVPEPPFRVDHAVVNGRLVIALFVETGNRPPYGLYPEKPEFYVRRGATTFRARQDEVRALAQPPPVDPYGSIPNPLDGLGIRRLG